MVLLRSMQKPNISFDFFFRTVLKDNLSIDLDWFALSAKKLVTMEIIERYASFPWNDKMISANPNIDINYVKTARRLVPGSKVMSTRTWFMPYLSGNPGITERDIYKNVLDWDYLHLSSNPNLPAKYVSDNANRNWNYFMISKNKNINMTDFITFHNIRWDWYGVSCNPNININYVLSNKTKEWSRELLLSNSAISLNDIERNSDFFNVPNKEKYMSSNSTITKEWIVSNSNNLDWRRLSQNSFTYV